MDALIYRVMSYDELLERLNQTELKKQEERYNREVNADMEKNRKQWEEIMNKAENHNESLTDPATISGDPADI